MSTLCHSSKRHFIQYLPPLSSDLREEGGSHTVLSSYKGSKDSSYPRKMDSVGLPSEVKRYEETRRGHVEKKRGKDKRKGCERAKLKLESNFQ